MTEGVAGKIDAFAARYPRVWHVMEAEAAGCEILYPAATLRRLAGLPADHANRAAFQAVRLPDGSAAILRMQLMPDERLDPTLAGAFAGRPDAWRDHINQHVFFWVAEDRRDRFARACVRLRARGAMLPAPMPIVLELDTRLLLSGLDQAAFFSRINSGSTVRGGARARRDEATLCPLFAWRGEHVAELAIRAPVPLVPHATGASRVLQATHLPRATRSSPTGEKPPAQSLRARSDQAANSASRLAATRRQSSSASMK